jgi:hypothetical protein
MSTAGQFDRTQQCRLKTLHRFIRLDVTGAFALAMLPLHP